MQQTKTIELLYNVLGFLSCKSPNQDMKNDLHKRVSEHITELEGSKGSNLKSMNAESLPLTRPFLVALNKAVQETKDNNEKKANELGQSSNIILQYATPSMNPDDYTSLEQLLVKLYRHHMNI